MTYAPFLTDPKDVGPNIPTTVADIPHLSAGAGPSEIEEQTGNLATPALGWQSPSLKQGFWLLTTQGSRWGNHGITIRESDDRRHCMVKVVAPRHRTEAAGRVPTGGKPRSRPRLAAGRRDHHTCAAILYRAVIQSIFDRFADIRKELVPGPATAPAVPMSYVWQLIERKRTSRTGTTAGASTAWGSLW